MKPQHKGKFFVEPVLPLSFNVCWTILKHQGAVLSAFPRHIHYFSLDSNFPTEGWKKNEIFFSPENSCNWYAKVFNIHLRYRLMLDLVVFWYVYSASNTGKHTADNLLIFWNTLDLQSWKSSFYFEFLQCKIHSLFVLIYLFYFKNIIEGNSNFSSKMQGESNYILFSDFNIYF